MYSKHSFNSPPWDSAHLAFMTPWEGVASLCHPQAYLLGLADHWPQILLTNWLVDSPCPELLALSPALQVWSTCSLWWCQWLLPVCKPLLDISIPYGAILFTRSNLSGFRCQCAKASMLADKLLWFLGVVIGHLPSWTPACLEACVPLLQLLIQTIRSSDLWSRLRSLPECSHYVVLMEKQATSHWALWTCSRD